jgi:hypothetical protein
VLLAARGCARCDRSRSCIFGGMSVTFTPDSLLGEVLAHVLAAQGAPSEIILAAAAAVFNIGLQTLRDVHEPYVTQLHGGDSPQWSALRQALESAGVPPAAIETVLGALALELVHVGLCGSQQPSQCVATSEVACSSSTAAREVRSSAASAPDAKRESREHVLPPDMINLRTVLLRLERAIVAYDRCANLEKQRAPGYTIAKNWKQRHMPDDCKFWNVLDSPALRQLQACATLLLQANGSFVIQRELFSAAREIDPTLAHTSTRSKQPYNPRF